MPYVANGSLKIHYEELAGDGAPLVLVFGFGMSVLDWIDLGYVEQLETHFRVIAVEPRGHGWSGSSTERDDYRLALLASDVVSVMNERGLERATLWGYSLGAKIALGVARGHPEKLAGLVLGGFELVSDVKTDDIVIETLRKGGAAWRDLWGSMMLLPNAMADRLSQVNTSALISLREAEGHWESLAGVPERISVPTLLYAGEHCFGRDVVRAAATAIGGSRYVELPGLTHFEVMRESIRLCDEVKRFFS